MLFNCAWKYEVTYLSKSKISVTPDPQFDKRGEVNLTLGKIRTEQWDEKILNNPGHIYNKIEFRALFI